MLLLPLSFGLTPAPAYDHSAISAYRNAVASGTATTWTQTATPGAYAIVSAFSANQTNCVTLAATATVTFGGQAMASLGNVYCDNGSANGFLWVWGLANVAGGSNTVSLTFTQSGDTFTGFGSSFTYLNVSSVGSLTTAYGSSTTPSVSVTSGLGSTVWGAVSCTSTSNVASTNVTTRQANPTNATAYPQFVAGDCPGASSVSVSGTASNAFYWAAAGVSLS